MRGGKAVGPLAGGGAEREREGGEGVVGCGGCSGLFCAAAESRKRRRQRRSLPQAPRVTRVAGAIGHHSPVNSHSQNCHSCVLSKPPGRHVPLWLRRASGPRILLRLLPHGATQMTKLNRGSCSNDVPLPIPLCSACPIKSRVTGTSSAACCAHGARRPCCGPLRCHHLLHTSLHHAAATNGP